MNATAEHENEALPADAISASAAAQLIGVHFSTVKRWVEKGTIRGWYKGERIFVSEREVRGQVRRVPVKAAQEAPRTPAQAAEAARQARRRIDEAGWR